MVIADWLRYGERIGEKPQMKAGLYKINLGNDRFYVGSSVDLKNRQRQHIQDLKRQQHRNDRMQKSFDKHGVYDFKVLMYCSPDDLMFYEQRLLNHVFSDENCVNLSPSAETIRGLKHRDNCKCHPAKTHCLRGHEFNEANTYVDKQNKKHCRLCARIREKKSDMPHGRDKTHCKRGHEFNKENTYLSKQGKRICQECRRARDRKNYWLNKQESGEGLVRGRK